MQALLVETAVPGAGYRSVCVAGARDYEAFIVFGFWRGAGRGGVGDDVHAHRFSHACDLSAYGAIAEDGEALARFIFQAV